MSSPAPTSRASLLSNAGSLMAGRVCVALLGWAGTVLIARELGQEAFGQFALVFSLLGMLSIVTDLGLGPLAVTVLARAEHPGRVAGSYVLLRSVLGVVGYGAVVGFVAVAGYPPQVLTATAVAGLTVVFATSAHAYDAIFQVHERLRAIAVVAVVTQLAQVALTVALVMRGGTLAWFAVPAVLNDALLLAWKAPAAHRLLAIRYAWDRELWRSLLRQAVPLGAGAAFVTLYYRLDSVLLSKLDTFDAVASYAVAYKFVTLLEFAPTAVAIAFLAPLTASWAADRVRFSGQLEAGARLLLVMAGAAIVGSWMYGPDAVALLYGDEYRSAGETLRILVVAACLGFLSILGVTALTAASRHRVYPLITFTGLTVNVVANLVLIPRYSVTGAAAATLATEALVLVLLWRTMGGLDSRPPVTAATVRTVGLASAAGVGAGLATGAVLGWIAAALATAVAYTLVVVLTGGLVGGREALAGAAEAPDGDATP